MGNSTLFDPHQLIEFRNPAYNYTLFRFFWDGDRVQSFHFANVEVLLCQATLSPQNLLFSKWRIDPKRQECRDDVGPRSGNDEVHTVSPVQRFRDDTSCAGVAGPNGENVAFSNDALVVNQVRCPKEMKTRS